MTGRGRAARWLVPVCLALLGVAGCAAPVVSPVAEVGVVDPTEPVVPPAAPQSAEPPAAPELEAPHLDVEATPVAVPSWDEASRETARRAAINAMTAFAADLEAGQWWHELAPLLSPGAQAAYVGTAPENVPVNAVGRAVLSATDPVSAFVVDVEVSTDVGDYVVLLSREATGEPWLVERLSPPADLVSSG